MRTPAVVSLITCAVLLCTGLATPPAALAVAGPTTAYGVTWTVDPSNDAIVEYAAGAHGPSAPIATISGTGTGLNSPSGVVTDDSGNIYVTNAGNSSITEYAAGSTGAAVPIATIAGTKTGLNAPSSISFGEDLMVWVTDPDEDLVEAFSPGDNGNVLPAERIGGSKTLLDHPVAVTSGTAGVWVANDPASGLPSVENFEGVGDNAPEERIHGAITGLQSPTALVAEDFDAVYVADATTNTISEFGAIPGIGNTNKPFGDIKGTATGLDHPVGLAIDAVGQFVVANAGDNSVAVFASNAAGDARPRRTITGVGGAAGPAGVAVFTAAPGSPGHIRVHAGNSTAHLTWDPPADTGGGIEGYDVEAFPIPIHPSGSFLTSSSENDTTKTSITLHGLTNGVLYEFDVSAYNAFGQAFESGPQPINLTATPYGPPGRPRGITAVPGAGSLQIFWARPVQNGGKKITHYRVQYATCTLGHAGCTAKTVKTPGTARRATLTGLSAQAAYRIRVIAQTSFGRGKPSRTVKAGVAGYVAPAPTPKPAPATKGSAGQHPGSTPRWLDYTDDACITMVRNTSPSEAVNDLTNGGATRFATRHDADHWISSKPDDDRYLVAAGRMGKWTFVWETFGFQCSLRAPTLRTSKGTTFVSAFWDEEDLEDFTLAQKGHILRKFDPVFPGRKQGRGRPLTAEAGLPWGSQPEYSMVRLMSRLTGEPTARPGWRSRPGTKFWGYKYS